MYEDRRHVAGSRAMAVARAYERQVRRAEVVDVSAGDGRAALAIQSALKGIDAPIESRTVSADLLSETTTELRIVEVKGRGSSGPIQLPERELDTLRAAGRCGWLYVVWNTTQPGPYRLWLVQDPARLGWSELRSASRGREQARGVRHEGTFQITSAEVEESGVEVDLAGLIDLPNKL